MPFRTPDHVRVSERRRYRRLTDERLAAELCPNCGLRPPAPDRRRCEVCGEQQRVADRARYARAKAEGSHSAKARSAIPSPTDFLSALSFLRWPLVKVLSSIPLDDFSFMIPPAVSRLEAAARLYRRRLRPARRRPRDGALPCSQAIGAGPRGGGRAGCDVGRHGCRLGPGGNGSELQLPCRIVLRGTAGGPGVGAGAPELGPGGRPWHGLGALPRAGRQAAGLRPSGRRIRRRRPASAAASWG